MSSPPKRQVVLITGATRGIGRAAALEVARRGHTVVATGRDVDRLDSLRREAVAEGLSVEAARLDVTDPEACEALTSGTIERLGRIDALVNNAGYGLWGPWEHVSEDEVRTVFETNFIGAMRLAKLVIPGMREQGFGTIINVGSIAGQASSPAGGAYAATKFAMNTMSRSMRLEVGRFGVRVVLLEPGIFKTDFVPSQIMARAMDRETTPYEPLRREEPLPGGLIPWPGPARVARRIRQVVEARRPRARYTVGYDAFLGAIMMRLLPDCVVDFAVRKATGW